MDKRRPSARSQQAPRHAREREALGAVANALVDGRSLRRVAEVVVDQAQRVLEAAVVALWLADLPRDEIRLIAQRGLPEKTIAEMDRIPLSAPSITARAARTGKPVEIVDALAAGPEEALTRRWAEQQGIHAGLAQPLFANNHLVGVLSISKEGGHRFEQRERDLFRALADLSAAAIENARLYEEAEVRQRAFAFLAETTSTLASSLDLDETLRSLARIAADAIGDFCLIYLREDGRMIRAVASAHRDSEKGALVEALARHYRPNLDNPMTNVEQVFLTGEPVLVPDVPTDFPGASAAETKPGKIIRKLGPRTAMIVPLIARGQTLGAVALVGTESGRRFGTKDLAVAQELSNRAALAVDNALLYREARLAIWARDEFLKAAAHELKTPMTVLRLAAQLTIREIEQAGVLDPDRVRKALQQIDRHTAALADLVAQLLDTSELETGRLTLDLSVTNVTKLVEGVVAAARTRTSRHVFNLRAPAAVFALIDLPRMKKVLAHLIDNAVKYSADGGPIDIDLTRQENGFAMLSVRDHGVGVPAERRSQIFRRFYQSHDTSHRSGMGQGLFISREIVALHGGTIEATFPDDGGTRFVIRLPTGPSEDLAPSRTEC